MAIDLTELEDADQPLPADDPAQSLPGRRRNLPWSDRTIFMVSLVVVLVLSPIWIGPNTLLQMVGINPAPSPSLSPSPSAAAVPSPRPPQ